MGEKSPTQNLRTAKKILIMTVQKECFSNPRNVPLIIVGKDNEGLLHVKSKITKRKGDSCFLTPILLPANCALTTRLVAQIHLSWGYSNTAFNNKGKILDFEIENCQIDY
ncbi:hypothetical protein TNCT_13881 [Trichonephila clavata]|uniref:Uncharacterized protein n=1 Tax=Trichonephila clavata TaxID=2740835 RepID=A0A8X6I0K5_TRICU|nr:hypothetical protein TNCT_13881 [Trichonephila clavata]